MDSSDGRYGWAADDPRWTDELAGGRGRLEPSPAPRFGAGEPAADDTDLTTGGAESPTGATGPTGAANGVTATDALGAPAQRPADLPPWPPAPPPLTPPPDPQPVSPPAGPLSSPPAGPLSSAPSTSDAPPAPLPGPSPVEPLLRSVPPAEPLLAPVPPAVRDLFGPPLAIGATPAPAPPLVPGPAGNGHGPAPASGGFVGSARVPSPAPTSVPLRLHAPLTAPQGLELHTGYGLSAGAAPPAAAPAPAPVNGGELARATRPTRLDRRVRIRSRWSTEDEFRRAARAELFSDDARYRVLFGLTAAWYVPVTLIYLVWTLLVTGDSGASAVFGGLLWLAAAAGVSIVVAGLLRWASIGWRAMSLSVAAAIVGGGITTIAQTLTG